MEVPVKVVEIDEAAVHLEQLVDEATRGSPFVIAEKGKWLVKVGALTPEEVVLLESK